MLGEKRKGKLPSKWAEELDEIDISNDEMDMEEREPSVAAESQGACLCDGQCLAKIAVLEETLGRVERMVKMLVTLVGLASPAERLQVEKGRGLMAREWDISVAEAGEQAKAEAVVRATNKRVNKKELDRARAEVVRLHQEGLVRTKEAAKAVAEAERDRLVAEVKGCADGPGAAAVAERVVEAARIVVELAREVVASAGPVEIGGWQVAGGRKPQTVQMVNPLCRPLDGEKRKSLQEVVSKVHRQVGAANLGWGLVASPYTVNGGDEVLWTVREVEEGINGTEVASTVMRNLEPVWGMGSLVGCWVENKLSAYVVVRGIPEREWLSDRGGVQGLVDGNPGIMWGPRQPTVVSRAWNRVDIKEAAEGAVVWGLLYYGMKQTVHMAVGSGGASVTRQAQEISNISGSLGMVARSLRGGPTPQAIGTAVRRSLVGACFRCRKTGHWKNECPDGGGIDMRGHFMCGWQRHIIKDCPRRVRLAMRTTGGNQDKERVEQGPAEKRMGPNEKGWVENTKDIFDCSKGMEEAIQGMRPSGGPSGARS